MSAFTIGESDFLLDGRPFRVLSGALHYFRVHPDQWADRIHKARLMGLNTIETYVAWNAHAPTEHEWRTEDGLDLRRFLELVAAEGMYAIVRPGPYICAEWDNGGLPAWLFTDPAVGVRRNEPRYLAAVQNYLQRVFEIVTPQQIDRGGPVILVQVENEYGAYGDDADYLRTLVRMTRDAGVTVPLTTVDQPEDDMLASGSLPELHRTGSFGSRSPERLATLRRHQPTGPLMAAEYWDGWFDHWGGSHATTSAVDAAADLDLLLSTGASVNLYMFHGGTNFGLTSGANDKGTYEATVTSYDYDAPLDEAGQPTAKYWSFREVLSRYAPVPEEVPDPATPAPELRGSFHFSVPFLPVAERLASWVETTEVPTMDSLERFNGLVVYRTEVRLTEPAVLEFSEVRDRAYVEVDDRELGVMDREQHDRSIVLPADARTVTVIVEDQGRVNYGPRIGEAKGLIGPGTVDGQPATGWRALPVDLGPFPKVSEALESVGRDASGAAGPQFLLGSFDVDTPTDLFLDTGSWGKGIAWINGFCLGRFWSRPPQRTLFVPSPVLRPGANDVTVLDLEPTSTAELTFLSGPDLGSTEPSPT
jgi:beta-galactosidase